MDFIGEFGARFAYMTKYIVTAVKNNFDKWPNLWLLANARITNSDLKLRRCLSLDRVFSPRFARTKNKAILSQLFLTGVTIIYFVKGLSYLDEFTKSSFKFDGLYFWNHWEFGDMLYLIWKVY